MKLNRSIELWNKYGKYQLMATAYQDNILDSAKGSVITDVDGNELIDLESGQICSILGHGHPELIKTISDQMQQMLHSGTGFLNLPILKAAEKIASICPDNINKSLILSTGAEANEFAFRIAKLFTGRRGIVGFTKGYSGLTTSTMSVSVSSNDTSILSPGNFKILAPDCLNCPVDGRFPECNFLCLKVSMEMLNRHCAGNIAAFIAEPILSAGGMIYPPDGYFQQLKKAAENIGALLIFDEAQTGMGRTGKWFGFEHENIIPDILVLSKGVGGGYPASAVAVSDDIAAEIFGRISNFSSHQSDPVAGVAISTVIKVVSQENLILNAEINGNYFISQLKELSNTYGIIKNIRGKGLMIGMDAGEYPETGLTSFRVGQLFEALSRHQGVHMKSIHNGKIFRILPALTITREQIDKVIGVFDQSLKRIIRNDFDKNILESKNKYTHAFRQVKEDRFSIKRFINKGWKSSPEQIVSKVTNKVLPK